MKRTTNASPAATSLAMSTKPRRRSAITALFAAAISLLVALPSFASADPLGSVSLFKSGLRPFPLIINITPGPDGNVWFVDNKEFAGTPAIGRIKPSGEITEFVSGTNLNGLNAGSDLVSITTGPDNKLWITDRGTTPAIASVDPASPEKTVEEKEFSAGLNAGSIPQGIVAGPDGNLWFTDAGTTPAIGMINPTTKEITEFSIAEKGGNAGSQPHSIVVGPDGNLWFTDTGTTRAIGKINPTTKEITEFPTGANTEPGGTPDLKGPWGIAAGADGNLWYTQNGTSKEICKITTSGTITCFSSGLVASSRPIVLTAAPDGKLWFTDTSKVNEKQKIKFEGTWATGNKFKLCDEAGSTCSEQEYSTTATTLRTRVKNAYNAIYGAGAVSLNPACSGTPFTCTVNFEEGTLVATNVGQTSCEAKSGSGTCKGEPEVDGVPNAVGSITTSGEITRYPISGIFSTNGITYSSGNLWFTVGFFTAQQLGKLGIGEEVALNVKKTGSGTGTVTSSPSGINCGGDCEEKYIEGVKVTLTATAESGSKFTGWSGAGCSGTGTCEVTMSSAKEVTAEFETEAAPGPELKITKEGSGDGTVASSPAGIECGGTCSTTKFKEGEKVTLTASPDTESLFVSWKGCEVGGVNGRECKVTMDKAKTVVAKFIQAYDVSLERKGTGLGKVGSAPGGILCLNNCSSTSAAFKELTNVTLTATPYKNFTFAGWSGDCEGTGTCILSSLSEDKEVEAEFVEVAKHLLSVSKKGGGNGTIKANLPGINCGATCSSMAALYYQGTEAEPTVVELTQTPGKGSAFGGWSGDCSGTGTCKVTMSAAKSVTAEFK